MTLTLGDNRWPAMVVAILGISLVANVVLVVSAVSDPSVVVEPNYYARSLAWDDEMRQATANRALGWTASARFEPSGRDGRLQVVVLDGQGAPVRGATVRVRGYHKARSAEISVATLIPSERGYAQVIEQARRGIWHFEVDVEKTSTHFTAALDAELRDPEPGVGGAAQ